MYRTHENIWWESSILNLSDMHMDCYETIIPYQNRQKTIWMGMGYSIHIVFAHIGYGCIFDKIFIFEFLRFEHTIRSRIHQGSSHHLSNLHFADFISESCHCPPTNLLKFQTAVFKLRFEFGQWRRAERGETMNWKNQSEIPHPSGS